MDTDQYSTHEDRRPVLYLEDLWPAQHFSTGSHLIEAAEIKAFAAQFDPQPFHLSEAAADGSFFAGLAASGWHTAAITMKLLVQSGPRLAGGVIGAGTEINWPQPVRPGDVLHVESEVVSVRPSRSRRDRGVLTLLSETLNQRGESVQSMTSSLVITRRP